METKILFTSDLHGSDTFFLKVLSTAKSWGADVLFLSGDLTGKAIIPIVDVGSTQYATSFLGKEFTIEKSELPQLEDKISRTGYYPYECSRADYDMLRTEPAKLDRLFDQLMEKRLLEWIAKIDELLPKNIRVIMTPGNDDPFFIDSVLQESKRTIYTVGKVEQLDDLHPLVSCHWVNSTPWKSPRECSEDELEKRLREEIGRVSSAEHLICDFHAPPYDCPLDLAPKLDAKLKPKTSFGQPVMEHVGSKSVRKVIEEFQPELAMHGHIHESPGAFRLGRTLCVNPGSEYDRGVMHGYFLKLSSTGIEYVPIVGG